MRKNLLKDEKRQERDYEQIKEVHIIFNRAICKCTGSQSGDKSESYVLSLNFPFTLGNFTIVFSILLIVLQILILRKNFKLENILQIPVSIAFGYFIDLTMYMLFWINPQSYFVKMIALLAGCLVLGFGVYLEVLADVVMLPGESFVRAIVQTWNTNFGTTKIVFDSSMAIIAGVLSFVFSGKLNGVREGTIIAALLVGFIARLLGKRLEFIKSYLFPEENGEGGQALASAADAENAENAPVADGITGKLAEKQEAEGIHKNVIVIGRQYGCGGHDIGKKLAEKFGYEFYDQEIIQMIAGTTGMTSEFIRQKEESMTNSLLYDFVNQMYLYGKEEEEAPKDKIFEAESKVIRELAAKGKCVIIGRCSDYVLCENEKTLKLFFAAPLEVRAKRIMERLNISKKEAEQVIRKEDRRRADNYRYYTGRVWGSAANVDLTFNTAMDERYIEECISKAMELEI